MTLKNTDGPAHCSLECQECRWQCQAVPLDGAAKSRTYDDQYHLRPSSNLGQSHHTLPSEQARFTQNAASHKYLSSQCQPPYVEADPAPMC